VRHFVVDRGGNGKRTSLFKHAARLPYLTMAQRSTELPAVGEATESGLPLQVTRDLAIAGETAPAADRPGPRRIAFPANPDRGAACEKAIEYLVNATLSTDELRNLDAVYKCRWGGGENVLKALQAVGFGVIRSRIELACSRGDDGKLARSEVRYEMLADTLRSISHRGSPKEARHFDRTLAKIGAETLKAQQIGDKPATKNVRVVDGPGELLLGRSVGGLRAPPLDPVEVEKVEKLRDHGDLVGLLRGRALPPQHVALCGPRVDHVDRQASRRAVEQPSQGLPVDGPRAQRAMELGALTNAGSERRRD